MKRIALRVFAVLLCLRLPVIRKGQGLGGFSLPGSIPYGSSFLCRALDAGNLQLAPWFRAWYQRMGVNFK
jgi:hypothetical protein